MADVKWIKIVTDIFDDEKILLIETLPEADSIIVCWFKLLCLAGKMNNSGVFLLNDRIAYTDKMLATIFRRKESTVKLALQTFESFGMIEMINGAITIPNWEKHQNIDGLDKIKEQTRLRVAKHREKQKILALNECNVTGNVTDNVTVTLCNATEKKRKDKIRKEKNLPAEDFGVDISCYGNELQQSIIAWLNYKKERRESYKRTGMTMFLNTVAKNVSRFGEDAVSEIINNSISSNYVGVVWDKIKAVPATAEKQKSWLDIAAEWEEENA